MTSSDIGFKVCSSVSNSTVEEETQVWLEDSSAIARYVISRLYSCLVFKKKSYKLIYIGWAGRVEAVSMRWLWLTRQIRSSTCPPVHMSGTLETKLLRPVLCMHRHDTVALVHGMLYSIIMSPTSFISGWVKVLYKCSPFTIHTHFVPRSPWLSVRRWAQVSPSRSVFILYAAISVTLDVNKWMQLYESLLCVLLCPHF